MSSQINLEEQDLANLKSLQLRKKTIMDELASIGYSKITLKKRKKELIVFMEESTRLESLVAKNLEEKYGKGTVDITTGTFTPLE